MEVQAGGKKGHGLFRPKRVTNEEFTKKWPNVPEYNLGYMHDCIRLIILFFTPGRRWPVEKPLPHSFDPKFESRRLDAAKRRLAPNHDRTPMSQGLPIKGSVGV